MVLSLVAKLSLARVTWCSAFTALPRVSLATVSGAGMAAGAATEAALATLAVPAGGNAAVVPAGAGAVVAAAGAVLAGAGVPTGAGSFLPQPPSSSRPATVALYSTVKRMDRVMGTPVSMTWQAAPWPWIRTPRLAPPI